MRELRTILDENSFVNDLNEKLMKGAVIAFVTDTVWGLGCLPTSKEGVDKIYEIKGRDRSKPLILMSDNFIKLTPFIKEFPTTGQYLADLYFPGALTLVVEKSHRTPDFITANKNTVGIRVPNNDFFRKLCSKIVGGVLATTSANLSNQPSSKTYEEAVNSIGKYVDYVFEDYGCECKGKESTVVLIEEESYNVLRQGSIIL